MGDQIRCASRYKKAKVVRARVVVVVEHTRSVGCREIDGVGHEKKEEGSEESKRQQDKIDSDIP